MYTFGNVCDTILMINSNFQGEERIKIEIITIMVLIDQK